MERKGYGGPITKTCVGGTLIFVGFLFFIYAIVFSIVGHELEVVAIIMWILTIVNSVIGILLLCKGISGIKETKRFNSELGRQRATAGYAYAEPVQPQPAYNNAAPAFCQYCGNEFGQGASFCSHCGNPRQ